MNITVLSLLFITAALLHGISGIGFPIASTAALSLFMPLKEAVILALWPTLLVNVWSVVSGGKIGFILRKYSLLALFSLLGSFIGAKLLFLVNPAYLQLLMSGVIAFYIINSLRRHHRRLPESAVVLALFGLIAGIIGGATNAMSPILMMCLLAMSQNHNEIVRAANLCFLLGKISQLAVLHQEAFQLFSSQYLWVILILTALSLLSLIIGSRLRRWISPQHFRRLVLGILGGLAIMSAVQALRVLISA
ncbi:sulfite exporter TauE/SafE family protein [Xenorhabdus sp. DI]|uniref:sulfite exporter TauE/SafE family protein n=1 Tax=Xenorhabdus doucetiae TaxID=351671 RepID=UPI0019928BC7|nr:MULTISPECIES: sulfite exporter TauE/SafE family protein [unclassified Xenorhabdus]MBD2783467.1 sulfite exporter TauE/SafE family protein [Xenorhabdus sp. 3]MBD2787727.1 sulfite exporter TauE/SafE family protein [Xenorhabdus sp. DI]